MWQIWRGLRESSLLIPIESVDNGNGWTDGRQESFQLFFQISRHTPPTRFPVRPPPRDFPLPKEQCDCQTENELAKVENDIMPETMKTSQSPRQLELEDERNEVRRNAIPCKFCHGRRSILATLQSDADSQSVGRSVGRPSSLPAIA